MSKRFGFWRSGAGTARLLGAASLFGLAAGGLAAPAWAQDEPEQPAEVATDTGDSGPGEAGANEAGEQAADAAQEQAGEELVVTGV